MAPSLPLSLPGKLLIKYDEIYMTLQESAVNWPVARTRIPGDCIICDTITEIHVTLLNLNVTSAENIGLFFNA